MFWTNQTMKLLKTKTAGKIPAVLYFFPNDFF